MVTPPEMEAATAAATAAENSANTAPHTSPRQHPDHRNHKLPRPAAPHALPNRHPPPTKSQPHTPGRHHNRPHAICLSQLVQCLYQSHIMHSDDPDVAFQCDEESIPNIVLTFAGLTDEFEDVDLCELPASDIKEIASELADHWDETEVNNGTPGGCCGLITVYAKDQKKFREALANALRPMCQQLAKQNEDTTEDDEDDDAPTFEGDEEVLAEELLRLCGLEAEFPETDLAMLDLPDIMDAACNHADEFNQEDFDEGMPGSSGAYVTIHVKDRDAFLRKFADELRPLCKELDTES